MTTGGTGPVIGPSNPINRPLDLYGKFFQSLFAGAVDFVDDPVYCMLCTSSYTPNQDSHQYKSDVTNEVVGSGYFEGGQALTGVEALYQVSGSLKQLVVTAGNLVWPSVTFSAAYAILYMNSAVPETQQPLIGYMNFQGTQSPADEAFYINWASAGVFTLTIPVAT